MREGLSEESLALFDLLKKDPLEKKDADRVKKVAAELLELLKTKKAEIDNWRAKEQTRDAMKQTITDFLYQDATGLPEAYSEEEVGVKSGLVYQYVWNAMV